MNVKNVQTMTALFADVNQIVEFINDVTVNVSVRENLQRVCSELPNHDGISTTDYLGPMFKHFYDTQQFWQQISYMTRYIRYNPSAHEIHNAYYIGHHFNQPTYVVESVLTESFLDSQELTDLHDRAKHTLRHTKYHKLQ